MHNCIRFSIIFERGLYKHVLKDFKEYYLKQGTPQDIVLYFSLLNQLLICDDKVLDYTFYIYAIESAINVTSAYGKWNYDGALFLDLYEHFQEILFSIIEKIPCSYILHSNLISCCIKNGNSELFLRIASLLLKFNHDGILSQHDIKGLLKDDDIVTGFRNNSEYIISCFNQTKQYRLTTGLNLFFQIFRYINTELKRRILFEAIRGDFIQISKMANRLTVDQKALFTRCILALEDIDEMEEELRLCFDRILEVTSVKEIFEYSRDAAYNFCCLLKQQDLVKREDIINDLKWIQLNFGEDISVKFSRKIEELVLVKW